MNADDRDDIIRITTSRLSSNLTNYTSDAVLTTLVFPDLEHDDVVTSMALLA